jgi:serine/threonine protein kinase
MQNHAQRSFSPIDFSSADQSLLDTLLAPVRNATPDPETHVGRNREDQVRIFAKQLLTALQYMHHRNIAHLDLRPEAILLQDDHLRLADFGQSRWVLERFSSDCMKL